MCAAFSFFYCVIHSIYFSMFSLFPCVSILDGGEERMDTLSTAKDTAGKRGFQCSQDLKQKKSKVVDESEEKGEKGARRKQ